MARLTALRTPTFFALAITLVACALIFARAQTTAEEARETVALVAGLTDQAADGAVLFAHHCSACHGDTGAGLDEARLSFPATHRDCTRCHRPTNPRTMSLADMTPRNAFDIGIAPPVVGPDVDLTRYGTGAQLFAYVEATMPRPFPGSLGEDAYLAIVAFLLAANGVDLPGDIASVAELAGVALR